MLTKSVDEWIATMIRKERAGDTDFDKGLLAIAVSLILKGEPLPESLRGWCVEALNPQVKSHAGRRKSGPNPQAKLSRNACIIRIVAGIASEYGFEPTRNLATRGGSVESACSIVTEALNQIGAATSEDSINKIYAKYVRRKN